MNRETRTNRIFWIAMGMLVTGGISNNALAVQNDIRYSINVPVLIENATNISGANGISVYRISIGCFMATKSEAINDDWDTFSSRANTIKQVKKTRIVGAVPVEVKEKNSLLTNANVIIDASYEQRVKNRRDHYACFISYITFSGNQGSMRANDKNLRIDQAKSVLKVSGKL